MKKLLVGCLLLVSTMGVMAQQEFSPNLYLMDAYRYNSAASGFTHGLNLSMVYANQWMGMEGAPRELSLSAHQLLRETNFSMGGLLSCERSGLSKRVECELAGTYRFLVSDWTWLSLSVGGGARVIGKDFSLLTQDEDAYYEKQARREVVPRFRMGAWLKWEDGSYCSFGVKGVGLGHLRSFGHKQSTHFYWSGEKCFPLRRNRSLSLSGMVYVAKYSPIALLLAPAIRMKKQWEMGLSYQTGRVVTPFVKLSLNDHFRLGASYCYSLLPHMTWVECSGFSLLLSCRISSDEKGRERLFRNAPL